MPPEAVPVRAVAWARVPATSANLGPGFDCLGLALPGWELRAWLRPAEVDPRRWTCDEQEVRWNLRGRGPAAAPPEENLVVRAICAAFARAGLAHPPAWRLAVRSTIPPARGLGSSAAAIVAGLAVANQWLRRAGRPLGRDDLLQIAADLEGHADNVAAALYGGAVVAWRDAEGRWRAVQVPLGGSWMAVLAVPATSSFTHEARQALPQAVDHVDAAFNAARAALLVYALTTGSGDLLGEAMQDRLHQPYRMALFPWLDDLIRRAVAAGADGACLSGAGPSVLALVPPERVKAVVKALAARLAGTGLRGRVGVCPAGGPGCRCGVVLRSRGGRGARRGVPPLGSAFGSVQAPAAVDTPAR
ncbi:homoserine kinase [Thermaerobacter marianensis DSM 12885]|uniref:Homoserine kinase n=1 Tax=Thermaerobacter marianensis (strain ATCC 700841 / DSM 12885 / JCM 10246 / 7p75a) TaxID=644966 RepID=E6SHW3_THEM7|nr:homoserine kinase [Thermaerobacter marianensis]ADU51843.1 homoserine kinase [Thermaerobacter marianensis DSM 12885]